MRWAMQKRIEKGQAKCSSKPFVVKNEVKDFIDHYLNSPCIEEDAFGFWAKLEQSLNPVHQEASKLAKFYLTPPPSTVDIERLFSTAGDILTNEGNQLKPENAEMILFCKENFKHVGFKY